MIRSRLQALAKRVFGKVGIEIALRRNLELARRREKAGREPAKWNHLAGRFDTILDVGANEGQFARIARQQCPAARLICFEPIPECADNLRSLAQSLGNMEVECVALGDRPGEAEFHVNEFSPSSSLLPLGSAHRRSFPKATSTRTHKVRVATLDDYAGRLVGAGRVLAKIDVQGGEYLVLSGARRAVEHVDEIVVEMSLVPLYDGQRLFDDVHALLSDLGFDFRGIIDQLRCPTTGEPLQIDGIYRKRSADPDPSPVT